MVCAYNFTGDKKYLKAGLQTFRNYIFENIGSNYGAGKKIFDDAVVILGTGPKAIAQSYYPVVSFYTAAVRAGFKDELIKDC